MTREELHKAWKDNITNSDGGILKIKHNNFKTVEFWPTSWEESVFHKFSGYWICLQNGEPIVNETIRIKKQDLVNWSIVDGQKD